MTDSELNKEVIKLARRCFKTLINASFSFRQGKIKNKYCDLEDILEKQKYFNRELRKLKARR